MENFIAQMDHLLREKCRHPAPPIPFPAFTLQKYYSAESWCAKYLKDTEVSSQDVTARSSWNPVTSTLSLPSDILKSSGACCVYGLCLLDETRLAALCTTEGYVCLDEELTVSISRTTLFCNWDKLLGELLLTGIPFVPPPDFEARKMIRLDFQATSNFRRGGRLSLDLRLVCPKFETAFFFPGYLIPNVDIQEGQIPKVRFVDHQNYQHSFTGVNLASTLFLIATPEHGDRFVIYPNDIDMFCNRSERPLRSYSIVSRQSHKNSTDDITPFLFPAGYTNFQEDLNRIKDILLPEMQILRQLVENIQPAATILDRYHTAIPTRGDLHHLLSRLQIVRTLEIDIVNITLLSLDTTNQAFEAFTNQNPISDYAWFMHPTNVPYVLPETPCQVSFIVLKFQCRQHMLDIFYINLLDYLCTFLNQYIWSGCRVISRERLEIENGVMKDKLERSKT